MSTRKSHTAGRLVVAVIAAVTLLLAAAPGFAASAIYYRVSGVTDDGGDSTSGVATSFICTNLDAAPQTVQLAVYNIGGALVGIGAGSIPSRRTVTFSTHGTMMFLEDFELATGVIAQGYATIASTSAALLCSVMIVDAGSAVPNGIALHLQRVFPLMQTQE